MATMTDEKQVALAQELKTIVEGTLKEIIPEAVKTEVGQQAAAFAAKMELERRMLGQDSTGLVKAEKLEFCEKILDSATGKAMLTDTSASGGLLVPENVYSNIFRIASQGGLVLSMAQKIPLATTRTTVPRYTGAELEGEYMGVDTELSETTPSVGDAILHTRTWGLVHRVDRKLLEFSAVNVTDFLMGLAAEGLALKIDRGGFTGTTPFVGILNDANVPTVSLAGGSTTYAVLTVDKVQDLIAAADVDAVSGAAFFMHASVLAELFKKRTNSGGDLELTAATPILSAMAGETSRFPQAMFRGYPVYTSKVLPKVSDGSQAGKPFIIFGSLKNLFYGDMGQMEFATSTEATVSGKSSFVTNQVAVRFLHDHAITVGLPSAFAVLKTAAS
jgi:HK97 family phage major capsid protein